MEIKKIYKNRFFQLCVVLICAFFAYKAIYAYDRRADGFCMEKIHSDLPFNPAWEVKTDDEVRKLANQILSQPFYYLGHGFQCYAFQSQDGKYVLKFFRHQRMRLSPWMNYVPDWIPYVHSFKIRREKEFEKRRRHLFTGIKVGFEEAPLETALLYVHLNKTKELHPDVVIYDKAGTKYVVKLDEVEFMLQHKAKQVKPTIDELMKEGKEEEAKKRLHEIYELLLICARKGVQDTDGALIRKNNLGYLDDRAIYIDSGKLTLKEGIKTKEGFTEDLKRLRPLHSWLKNRYPSLATYFEEERVKAIDEL